MNIEDHLGIDENPYGFKYFSKLIEVNVLEEMFVAIDESFDGISLDVKPLYTIYQVKLKTGQNISYLIVDKNRKLPLGENELYLKPLKGVDLYSSEEDDLYSRFVENPPLLAILKKMAKPYINSKELDELNDRTNLARRLIDTINENTNLFFELTTGVPVNGNTLEHNILHILDQTKIDNLINEYLTDGLHKDPLLLFAFKPNLLKFNSEIVRPQDIMPYLEHQVTFTNSKVGKTMLAEKTGLSIDDAKIANLLGFSTAKDVNKGSLNEETRSVAFDEIHENKNKNEWGHLLKLMEQGKTEVRKGKRLTICKTYSPLRFMSNPHYKVKGEEKVATSLNWEDYDLMHTLLGMFESMITTITDNFAAFSSRMAMTTFSKDLQVVSGNAYNRDKQIKLKKIVDTIFELTRADTSELFLQQNALDFLNEPYSKEYLAAVDKIYKHVTIPNLKDYIQGHRDSYRHSRGMAFKLGCIDNLMDLLRLKLIKGKQICMDCKFIKEEDTDTCACGFNHWTVVGSPIFMDELISAIITSATEHFEIIKDENLKSFKILAEQVNTNVYRAYYHMKLEKESLHIKTLVYAIQDMKPSLNACYDYDSIFVSDACTRTGITLPKSKLFERILKGMPHNNLVLRRYGIEIVLADKLKEVKVKVLEPYALTHVISLEEEKKKEPEEMTSSERAQEKGLLIESEFIT